MNKKQCINCLQQPSNLLILSCCHGLCLQCAYLLMNYISRCQPQLQHQNKNSMQYKKLLQKSDTIQIRCPYSLCNEATTINRQLQEQIQKSLSQNNSFNLSYKYNANTNLLESSNFCYQNIDSLNSCEQNQATQYLNRMRSQYLKIKSQRQDESKVYANQQNINGQFQSSFSKYLNITKTNYRNNEKNVDFIRQNLIYKKNNQQDLQKGYQKLKQQIFCEQHPGYEVLYICRQSCCQKLICPQCVIHGSHKNHKSLSFKQILSFNLPSLIANKTNQLIQKTNLVQLYQQSQQTQYHNQIMQIQKLKSDTEKYYQQIRQKINQQQKQAQIKCQDLQLSINTQKKQKQLQIQTAHSQIQDQIKLLKQVKLCMEDVKMFLNSHFSNYKIQKQSHINLIQFKRLQFKLMNQFLILDNLHEDLQFSQKIMKLQTCDQNTQILLNRYHERRELKQNEIYDQIKSKYQQQLRLTQQQQTADTNKTQETNSVKISGIKKGSDLRVKQQMNQRIQNYPNLISKQRYLKTGITGTPSKEKIYNANGSKSDKQQSLNNSRLTNQVISINISKDSNKQNNNRNITFSKSRKKYSDDKDRINKQKAY